MLLKIVSPAKESGYKPRCRSLGKLRECQWLVLGQDHFLHFLITWVGFPTHKRSNRNTLLVSGQPKLWVLDTPATWLTGSSILLGSGQNLGHVALGWHIIPTTFPEVWTAPSPHDKSTIPFLFQCWKLTGSRQAEAGRNRSWDTLDIC